MPRTLRHRITTRVVLLSATVGLLLGGALVLLIVAISGQRDAGRTALGSQRALISASALEASLISIENGLRGYVARGDERFLRPATESLGSYRRELLALARTVSDDAGQRRRVSAIRLSIEDYVALWARPLIALARANPPAARSVVTTNGGRVRLDAIRRDLARLSASEAQVVRQRTDRAEQRSSLAVRIGVAGLALVLAVAAGLAVYLRRAVVRPVLSVAHATARLASGDLSTRVPVDREDEIGDLARSFNEMADQLATRTGELERSNAELTRSNRELEQFASVTSHDLQAPLTTISMYAELLDRRHGTEINGGSELVDGIREATGQARTLIRDLLEYSRAGRGRLQLEKVPVKEVVDTALESLTGAIAEAQACITVGDMPVVLADRANLCRVFQNLIGNAIKFTRDRIPEVDVVASREGPLQLWRFSVSDNGIGLATQHRERVFEPFQRLHGEEDYPGTGIGLAICERIVSQHGGRIWVDSRPGQGSIFSFTLPAADAE